MTLTRKVTAPDVGAITVAMAVSAPSRAGGFVVGATTVHEKAATVRPQAALLPDALNETFWPGETDAGSATAAMGRSAASTARDASAMPAPQVVVVHRHWTSWKSWAFTGK